MTLQDIKRIGEFNCNIYHINKMTEKVKKNPGQVYELMTEYGTFQDSYTREVIFQYIADKYYNGNYDVVYNQWLES